jgi:hypothetical protein
MNKYDKQDTPRSDDRRQEIRQQNPGGDRNRVSDKAADEPKQNQPKPKGKKNG